MTTKDFTALRLCAALAFAFAMAQPAAADPAAKKNYEALLAREAERAGDIEFDYALGLAALEAGDAERAVFALERVLAQQPGHAGARLAIARAHLALGEHAAARRELEEAGRQGLDAGTREAVARQLAAVDRAEATQLTKAVEVGIGYDSNVNAATAAGQVAVPGLGTVVLDPNGRERGDSYAALSAGIGFAHRLAPRWHLVGGLSGGAKLNRRASDFDTLTLDASLGARRAFDRDTLTAVAQVQRFSVDYRAFRDATGIAAQWERDYGGGRRSQLFGQLTQLRYPYQDFRDADRMVFGAGITAPLRIASSPTGFLSAYAGAEEERDAAFPQFGHDLWGVRAGAQADLGNGWGAGISAAHERRRYHGEDGIFLVRRNDRQSDLGTSLSYLVAPGRTLTARLSHTDNLSNVAVFRFKRTMLTLSARIDL